MAKDAVLDAINVPRWFHKQELVACVEKAVPPELLVRYDIRKMSMQRKRRGSKSQTTRTISQSVRTAAIHILSCHVHDWVAAGKVDRIWISRDRSGRTAGGEYKIRLITR